MNKSLFEETVLRNFSIGFGGRGGWSGLWITFEASASPMSQNCRSRTGATMKNEMRELPDLAGRVDEISSFHVMELVKRAKQLEEEGRSIIHLNIGEPDFTAPQRVVEALKTAVDGGQTSYTGALGLYALRERIADHYKDAYRVEVDPRRVVVTAGASGALVLAFAALLESGREVLLSDPGYPCNRNFVSALGGIPKCIPVDAASRFQLNADLLRDWWSDRVAGVLLASPANPTGTAVGAAELERIVSFVREKKRFLVVDEIYAGLMYDEEPRTALAYGDDFVVTNSFSKFFHMTGWRLGWLVVPPEWVAAFEKIAQSLYICPSTLAQHAALACFDDESLEVFRLRRDEFKRRRDYLVPELRRLGLDVPVLPDGAFYLYIDCSQWSDDSDRFASEMLEQAGVSVVPGLDFGRYEPERYLRLSYANSMENLREAVARIEVWLSHRMRVR